MYSVALRLQHYKQDGKDFVLKCSLHLSIFNYGPNLRYIILNLSSQPSGLYLTLNKEDGSRKQTGILIKIGNY